MSGIHQHPYLHTDKYSCWMDGNKSCGNQGTSHKLNLGLPGSPPDSNPYGVSSNKDF